MACLPSPLDLPHPREGNVRIPVSVAAAGGLRGRPEPQECGGEELFLPLPGEGEAGALMASSSLRTGTLGSSPPASLCRAPPPCNQPGPRRWGGSRLGIAVVLGLPGEGSLAQEPAGCKGHGVGVVWGASNVRGAGPGTEQGRAGSPAWTHAGLGHSNLSGAASPREPQATP